MAEIIGSLREDRATYGERIVLERLGKNLPKDFTVYVECPLHQPARSRGRGAIERYPDFIVLANYGVVVLEVKDWVTIVQADKFGAGIRGRDGRVRRERNPVETAREFALLLENELKEVPRLLGQNRRLNVPWGSAVVLPHQPLAAISRLRQVWGEAAVLGKADIEAPDVSKRLRRTVPKNRMLLGWELDLIRGVINPSIVISPAGDGEKAFLLDRDQERIVAEPAVVVGAPAAPEEALPAQESLFDATPQPEAQEAEELLAIESRVALNASVRLVRGVAGSGKSLVLLRRAQYLHAQYPEWKMCALTFNDPLAKAMRAELKGTGIKVVTFHKLCSSLLQGVLPWKEPVPGATGWINRHAAASRATQEFGAEFLADEIQWIKEMGVTSREVYRVAERRGRGTPVQRVKRDSVYDIYEGYQAWLAAQGHRDWADIPHLVLAGMREGKIACGQYDAILIDEAQDFAPVWIAVVRRLLKPEGGLVFLADDPTQSIYRYYSWREKGIEVSGRTRWLRVPYRNTREIYEAAYSLVREDPELVKNLTSQSGWQLEPDLTGSELRSGPKPELRRFEGADREATYIRGEIEHLAQKGVALEQIAVLCRRKRGVQRLRQALRGLDVEVDTYHRLKGLEFDIVFLTQLEECFRASADPAAQAESEERRLVYMAMTRARSRLVLTSAGEVPRQLKAMMPHLDVHR